VADTGEVLVCLEDLSANGTLYNDRKVSKATVILCEGDRIEYGSCSLLLPDAPTRLNRLQRLGSVDKFSDSIKLLLPLQLS